MTPGGAGTTVRLRRTTRESRIDLALTLRTTGANAHHVAEDSALALGVALRRALPARGLQRFGEATVAMDESLVQVVIDLVDRPYYASDLPPDTLGEHLLRSLVLEGRFTFHQRSVRPGEIHHLLEATYKAFGLALGRAIRPAERELSLKGEVTWTVDP